MSMYFSYGSCNESDLVFYRLGLGVKWREFSPRERRVARVPGLLLLMPVSPSCALYLSLAPQLCLFKYHSVLRHVASICYETVVEDAVGEGVGVLAVHCFVYVDLFTLLSTRTADGESERERETDRQTDRDTDRHRGIETHSEQQTINHEIHKTCMNTINVHMQNGSFREFTN